MLGKRTKNEVKIYGEGGMDLEQSRLPFEIHAEHIEPFIYFEAGFNYSYTGVRFKFRRHDLGLLLGGYYGPTVIFAILSLISFFINPDVVSSVWDIPYCLDIYELLNSTSSSS